MRQYEVTFIVDPVLSGDEIKATAKTYTDMIEKEGCKIVHIDEMGLRQLAYPINRRTSGVYYTVEFQPEKGNMLAPMELAMRRDERIMRFLTVKLDKYGVKYNEDKRNGLIAKFKKKAKSDDNKGKGRKGNNKSKPAPPKAKKSEAPKPAAPAKAAAPATPPPAPAPTAKAEEE